MNPQRKRDQWCTLCRTNWPRCAPWSLSLGYVKPTDIVTQASSLLPSNVNRSLLVHSLVKAFGLLSPRPGATAQLRLMRPVPAAVKDLAIYHTRDYLDFVFNKENAIKQEHPAHVEFGLEDVREQPWKKRSMLTMVAGLPAICWVA